MMKSHTCSLEYNKKLWSPPQMILVTTYCFVSNEQEKDGMFWHLIVMTKIISTKKICQIFGGSHSDKPHTSIFFIIISQAEHF